MKSLVLKLGLMFASSAMLLVMLEVALRLSHYQPQYLYWSWATNNQIHTLDRDLIYSLRPGAAVPEQDIYISPQGFRYDPTDPVNQAKTNLRVAVVGDSIVWGNTPYHQTYPYLLEQLLTQVTQQPVQVIDAGVSGYGTDQEYKLIMDRVVPRLHPQVIIWNLNFNDLEDNVGSPLYDLQGTQLHSVPAWLNRIYLQGFFNHVLARTPVRDWLLANLFLSALGKQNIYPLSIHTKTPEQWSYQKMGVLFAQLESWCAAHQVQLVFAISPNQRYVERLKGWEAPAAAVKYMRQEIGPTAKVVDQNPVFIQSIAEGKEKLSTESGQILGSQTSPSLFLDESKYSQPGEWHPNGQGNALMAEAVKDELIQDRIITPHD